MRVVICDDQPRQLARYVRDLDEVNSKLRLGLTIEAPDPKSLSSQLRELRNRRRGTVTSDGAQAFDRADIVFIDYDLIELTDAGTETGESAAYLARCFSTGGYIVAMNQGRLSNPFDLTLSGHPESFADLDIGSDQLANPGLWRDSFDGFRPWALATTPKGGTGAPRANKRTRGCTW